MVLFHRLKYKKKINGFNFKKIEYKITTEIKHEEHENSPIIVTEANRRDLITNTDRKAFEDFFHNGDY
jgi:hypothetical protein